MRALGGGEEIFTASLSFTHVFLSMFVLPVCHSVPWNEMLRKHAQNHALLSHAAFSVQTSCDGRVTGLSGRHANPKVLFWYHSSCRDARWP